MIQTKSSSTLLFLASCILFLELTQAYPHFHSIWQCDKIMHKTKKNLYRKRPCAPLVWMDFVQIPLKTDHMINNDESERGESSDCPLASCCEGRETERDWERGCGWVGKKRTSQWSRSRPAMAWPTHVREYLKGGGAEFVGSLLAQITINRFNFFSHLFSIGGQRQIFEMCCHK